jgi:hypothetical protein
VTLRFLADPSVLSNSLRALIFWEFLMDCLNWGQWNRTFLLRQWSFGKPICGLYNKTAVIYGFRNKLECLSLASPSSLV